MICQPCPKCGSTEQHIGYGYAGGILGGYVFCEAEGCGILLELWPDLDGLDEARATELLAKVAKWRKSVWGATEIPRATERGNAAQVTP